MNKPTKQQMKARAEACVDFVFSDLFPDAVIVGYEPQREMLVNRIFIAMTNDIELSDN